MLTNDSPGATTRVIYVVGSGIDIASPVAAALAGGGARVAWISDLDGAPATALPDGVVRVPARFDSCAAVAAAFAVAQEALGPPQQVVLSVMPEEGVRPQDIVYVPRTRIGDINVFVQQFITQLIPFNLRIEIVAGGSR